MEVDDSSMWNAVKRIPYDNEGSKHLELLLSHRKDLPPRLAPCFLFPGTVYYEFLLSLLELQDFEIPYFPDRFQLAIYATEDPRLEKALDEFMVKNFCNQKYRRIANPQSFLDEQLHGYRQADDYEKRESASWIWAIKGTQKMVEFASAEGYHSETDSPVECVRLHFISDHVAAANALLDVGVRTDHDMKSAQSLVLSLLEYWYLCDDRDHRLFQRLIKEGFTTPHGERLGQEVLAAVSTNNIDALKHLVSLDASLSYEQCGQTPLTLAAELGLLDHAKQLLRAKISAVRTPQDGIMLVRIAKDNLAKQHPRKVPFVLYYDGIWGTVRKVDDQLNDGLLYHEWIRPGSKSLG